MDSWREVAVYHREPSLVLCDALRSGMEGGEEGSRGRGYKCNSGWFALLYGRNQHNIVNFKKQKLKNQHILKKKKRLKQGRRMWTSSLIRRNISFLTSTWLVLGSSPRCLGNFLLRWIPPQRPVGICPHLWDGNPSLQAAFLRMCRREVFLDLKNRHLIFLLQQSSASATSLECVGENKASVLLHLTNTSCPAQGPIYLLPQL